MNNTRYMYRTVPLPEKRAKEIRESEIESYLEEISYRQNQISELQEQLARLREEPLQTSYQEQLVLNPGDPGYDEAPALFRPENYQGELTWVNTEPYQPAINEIRKLPDGSFAIGNSIPTSNVVQNQLRDFYERTLAEGASGGFMELLKPEK